MTTKLVLNEKNGTFLAAEPCSMKFKYPYLILLLFAISLNLCNKETQAQKIFSCDSKYEADIKVFVVDSKYDSDLVVFKLESKYEAKGNSGLWYFVDSKYEADKKIFFTDSKYDADLLIWFTASKYDTGWRNKERMHLLY